MLARSTETGATSSSQSGNVSCLNVWLVRDVQARRHCSIDNTQPNRSQHIPFTSSTHFILPSLPSTLYAPSLPRRRAAEKGNRNGTNVKSFGPRGRSCHPSESDPFLKGGSSRSLSLADAIGRFAFPPRSHSSTSHLRTLCRKFVYSFLSVSVFHFRKVILSTRLARSYILLLIERETCFISII